MSTHSVHPDTHHHGLADGCERCREHGEDPFQTLDMWNLQALIQRLHDGEEPRSDNEARAMQAVAKALRISGQLERATYRRVG